MRRRSLLVLVLTAASACSPQPQPIAWGEDVGDFCRMVIVDQRYGAELVTNRGRVYKFDSVECLAGFLLAMDDTGAVHSLWVTPFQSPGDLIRIEDAIFLHSATLKSPMGANLTAFRTDAITPEGLVSSFGGEVLDWAGVLALVSSRGAHPVSSPLPEAPR